MNLSVMVLHNVSTDMFFRYDPETSKLFHAHTFQVVADNIEKAADLVWTLTNVGDSSELRSMRSDLGLYGAQVDEYRARQNRSLSVGDVLVFHEVGPNEPRFAGTLWVASVGFQVVHAVPLHKPGINETPVSESYLAHKDRAADPSSRLFFNGD